MTARILVTGAGTGLGLGAARELHQQGHHVVAHVRTPERANDLHDIAERGATVVTADLSVGSEVRALAVEVADMGGVDAVIHNAGAMSDVDFLPVNVVAPYLLTALLPARRLVYLSSSMHFDGTASLTDLDWSGATATASYLDSKLFVTTLAALVARLRPEVFSNAVDPGWVPTRMGGPHATDDLELGHRTQAWLAAGVDAATHVSAYWHHQQRREPHPSVNDTVFQDALGAALAEFTGVVLT